MVSFKHLTDIEDFLFLNSNCQICLGLNLMQPISREISRAANISNPDVSHFVLQCVKACAFKEFTQVFSQLLFFCLFLGEKTQCQPGQPSFLSV